MGLSLGKKPLSLERTTSLGIPPSSTQNTEILISSKDSPVNMTMDRYLQNPFGNVIFSETPNPFEIKITHSTLNSSS